MSASVQFGQLDFWKPARELVHEATPMDSRPGEEARTWNIKRHNNRVYGRVSATSVAENGIEKPVLIYHNESGGIDLEDGHHRVIAAYDHSPTTLVPVKHEWKGTNPRLDHFREEHPRGEGGL